MVLHEEVSLVVHVESTVGSEGDSEFGIWKTVAPGQLNGLQSGAEPVAAKRSAEAKATWQVSVELTCTPS